MKINWKVRFKNPQWWFSVILAVAVPIGAYYGITGSDITSWGLFFSTLKSAVLNPYVVFSVLASVWNAVIDPTTSGISDSVNALTYKKPKCNGQ
jgi:phi LC3 family holin